MVSSYALRPAWTPLTVVLMIVGFFVFWPLGLVMLAYILWGHRIPEVKRHFQGAGEEISREFRGCGSRSSAYRFTRSGNVAFDDYREKELKRLDEERRRLEDERREFEGYVRDLRRARDKEEFDRFMSERAAKRTSGGEAKGGESIDL